MLPKSNTKNLFGKALSHGGKAKEGLEHARLLSDRYTALALQMALLQLEENERLRREFCAEQLAKSLARKIRCEQERSRWARNKRVERSRKAA